MSHIAKYTVVYNRPIFGEATEDGFVEVPENTEEAVVRVVRSRYGKMAVVIVWWITEIKPARNWEGL